MCIYCRSDGSAARGLPHVFPEAVVQNEMVLPRGVICDPCNFYLRKLDEALARHPAVAYAVQQLGLPGKRGKPRDRVANIDRDHEDASFAVDIGPLEIERHEDGNPIVVVKPMLDVEFDLLRFRRALHLVAFNYLAREHGAALALEDKFDEVRRYVRRPHPRQAWPFVVRYRPGSVIREIRLGLYVPDEFGLVAMIGMFNHDFYVDLLNTGNLGHWILAAEIEPAEFVGPGAIYPASPRNGGRAGEEAWATESVGRLELTLTQKPTGQ
jgi:hypothetical protein